MLLTNKFVVNTFFAIAFIDIVIKFVKWIKIKDNSSKSFLQLQFKYFISYYAIQIPLIIQSPFVYRRYVDDSISDMSIAHIKIIYNISAAIFSIFIGNILSRFDHRKIISICNFISVIASTLRAIGKKTNFIIAAVFIGFASSNVRVTFEDWFISEEKKITDCPNSHFIFTENLSLLNIVISVVFLSFGDFVHKKNGTQGIFYFTAVLQAIGSLIVFFFLTKSQTNNSKIPTQTENASKNHNQTDPSQISNTSKNHNQTDPSQISNTSKNHNQTDPSQISTSKNHNQTDPSQNTNNAELPADTNSNKTKKATFSDALRIVLSSRDPLLLPFVLLDQLYGVLVSLFWPTVPSFFPGRSVPLAKIIGMGQMSILLGAMLVPLLCARLPSTRVLPFLFLLSSACDVALSASFGDKFALYWLIFALCLLDGCAASIMLGLRVRALPSGVRGHILGANKLCQSVLSSLILTFSERFEKSKQPLFSAAVLFACFVIAAVVMVIENRKRRELKEE